MKITDFWRGQPPKKAIGWIYQVPKKVRKKEGGGPRERAIGDWMICWAKGGHFRRTLPAKGRAIKKFKKSKNEKKSKKKGKNLLKKLSGKKNSSNQ